MVSRKEEVNRTDERYEYAHNRLWLSETLSSDGHRSSGSTLLTVTTTCTVAGSMKKNLELFVKGV